MNNNFFKNTDLKHIYEESKIKKIIPPIIHRLLLYDEDFPHNVINYLNESFILNKDFYNVLWRENDLISIMSDEETLTYMSYRYKIQKSDYARYIILKYNGGLYCDLDVEFTHGIYELYSKYNTEDLFFEEITISEEFAEETKNLKIRNGIKEYRIRIANYIIMSLPYSDNIQGILNICEERKVLTINEEYDIIFTTGPDVVSQYINDENINYLNKNECYKYFSHHHVGHWRFSN
jgi:hypothetical protein